MPNRPDICTLYLETEDWPLLEIQYTKDALVSIQPVKREGEIRAGRPPEWLERMLSDLSAFLDRGKRKFAYVPLDMDGLSDFQQAVISEMRDIPFGRTKTYGEIAEALKSGGKGASARAVGQACGRNPFPLVVPCHRVVAEGGLGGFGWGLKWKKRLLALEGSRS